MRARVLCCILIFTSPGFSHAIDVEAEAQKLLAVHESFKAAHLRSDPAAVLQRLADDYVRVSRGEIEHPDPDSMAVGMRSYLESTRFTQYRDLREPIVKVSADGTLGWIIVQLRAEGTQTDASGKERSLDFVCAWISLFEKQGGEWVNIGDVSTFKQ